MGSVQRPSRARLLACVLPGAALRLPRLISFALALAGLKTFNHGHGWPETA